MRTIGKSGVVKRIEEGHLCMHAVFPPYDGLGRALSTQIKRVFNP